MKKVLAVSGGIDSMVMLHLMREQGEQLIIAHFDHGIRPNSREDCDFVERAARRYNLHFVCSHAQLGADCSEECARQARYDFLYKIARQFNGRIYTAHHADDVVESMLINLLRGTGWRGIAPLANPDIERPLIKMTKADIYRYAAQHKLVFREDQSNSDTKYLRNRVRASLRTMPPAQSSELRRGLTELYWQQIRIYKDLGRGITEFCDQFLAGPNYSRRLFRGELGEALELELLRELLRREGILQTRPQLLRGLYAIKNFGAGKKFSLDKSSFLCCGKYYFSIRKA